MQEILKKAVVASKQTFKKTKTSFPYEYLTALVYHLLQKNLLSCGQMHPIRDKFNELNFLAEIDKLVLLFRESETDGEKFSEIEGSANC